MNTSLNAAGTMMLETDGTVLMEGGGVTNAWYRLTPDSSGSYVNGTWTQLASMAPAAPLLTRRPCCPTAGVMVEGGEYSGTQGRGDRLATRARSTTRSRTPGPTSRPFPEPNFGDDRLELCRTGTSWPVTSTGRRRSFTIPRRTRGRRRGPSCGTIRVTRRPGSKLPDGSILSYDIWSASPTACGHAQRYIPSTNTWVDAGIVPVALEQRRRRQ